MIISPMMILELNDKYKIIENLCEREKSPEGFGFDIRAKEVFKLSRSGFLGVYERKTCKSECIASINLKYKTLLLRPNSYVLVKTMERFNIPNEPLMINNELIFLVPIAFPRSTLQRCGILLLCTKTDPGYSGELVFGMKNVSKSVFRLEMGARIANIVFFGAIGGIARTYQGQWRGGRVSTGKKERMN